MRLEERVTELCAQAIAPEDEVQAQSVLGELRGLLHRRIEEFRNTLAIVPAARPPS
jgi:hypothetical protein